MLVLDRSKAIAGHYLGLTDWLNTNVGEEEVDYTFDTEPRAHATDGRRLSAVQFTDQQKEILAIMRWA